jgi:hypothetical protein
VRKWVIVRKDGSKFYLLAETQQAAIAEFRHRHPGAKISRTERVRKTSPSEWARLSRPPQPHKICPFCHKDVSEKRWGLHVYKCRGAPRPKAVVFPAGRIESNRRKH